MTGNRPYDNPASQDERRQVLRDTLLGRRAHKNTYFAHAHSDEGGRFSAPDQPPRYTVGSEAVPRYPAGPNWSADPVGPEPSLGFSVENVPPTGEMFEIEKSVLAESPGDEGMIQSSSPISGPPSGGEVSSGDPPKDAVDAASPPPIKQRRRKR
jgi:hypothetical protein